MFGAPVRQEVPSNFEQAALTILQQLLLQSSRGGPVPMAGEGTKGIALPILFALPQEVADRDGGIPNTGMDF